MTENVTARILFSAIAFSDHPAQTAEAHPLPLASTVAYDPPHLATVP
jgi:hypothetical protein